jgi:hypothetical protein
VLLGCSFCRDRNHEDALIGAASEANPTSRKRNITLRFSMNSVYLLAFYRAEADQ